MSTNTPLSRIAHHLTLRRLETTALSSTVLALILTVGLVETGLVHEANPVTAALAEQFGWATTGLLGIGVAAAAFGLFRAIHRRGYDRSALAGGVLLAGLGVADFGVNLVRLAQVGWPASLPEGIVATTAPAVVGAVVVAAHPYRGVAIRGVTSVRPTAPRFAPAAMALLLITSTFAGVVVIGTQPLGDGQSGTASAAPADELWNSSTGGSIYKSSPTVANGTAYVGVSDNSLYAFDVETGTEKWSAATGDNVASNSPTVANGTVYIGSYDGSVYAFDAETGNEEWSAATGSAIQSSPTVANGTVHVGSADGSVHAFDAETGNVEWSATAGDSTESSPTVTDGTVYLGSEDGSLYAFDAETGNEEWSAATGDGIYESSPTVADGTVYIGSDDGSLHAFDAETGAEEWSSATGDWIRSSPTVADGTVYVGSHDNSLYAFDAETGAEEWSAATGDYIASSPTVADGTVYVGSQDNSLYAFDAATGTEEWSYATGGGVQSSPTVADGTVYVGSSDGSLYALDTDHSKDSSGSRNELHTLGHVGPVEQTSGSTGADINGTVENQNGDPAANTTVVGWGVDYSNISAGQAQSLEDRAREIIQESSNVRPDAFDPELQLTGGDGKLRSASEPYVAVHTRGDWNIRTSGDEPAQDVNPDLGQPMVQAPANEELVFSAWNPENDPLVQDSTDGDLPGSTIPENQTIVVEQIGPSNSTIKEPLRLETEPVLEYGTLSFSGKTHYAATAELPTGFYRVSVENSSFSYVMAVGDTGQMVQAIQADLNASATEYSERAKEVRQKLDQGKLTRYKTTTDENGSFAFSTDSNVQTVAIQAYKTPPGMTEDPENATLEDIRTYYATTDYNGSVVLPSEVKTVNAPSSNNTVQVREYSAPNYPDLGQFKNKTEMFNQWLKNLSYSELPSQFQQPETNVTRELWKASYEERRTLVEGVPGLEERAQELLGEDEELFVDADEASTDELRQRATVMKRAMTETPNTINTGELETSTTTETISARFPFDTDLAAEDVMITAQYPNGTTKVLNTSSEYVSVESGIGADAVVIEEFPTSSEGPGSVTFDVDVANEDGIASARETVDNPAKSGTPPSIASISLSTLRPGPDETVSMTLDGGEETTITNISKATVYGPDGSKLDTDVTSAREIEYTTAGQGIHTMQVTFETSNGQTATVTERVTAGTNPKAMPPGVRVSESPLGVYAVTGDGIETGEVSIEDGGSGMTVLAQVNETADVPNHIHVYTSGVSLPPSSDLTVRVVKGSEQQAVGQNVVISTHLPKLASMGATIYANGEPLPRDGGNANGEVSSSASGTTVETLTDANGVLELSTDASPGFLASQVYAIELSTGIDIPGLVILPPTQPATPLWGLVPGAGWVPFDAIAWVGDAVLWSAPPATSIAQPAAANPVVAA